MRVWFFGCLVCTPHFTILSRRLQRQDRDSNAREVLSKLLLDINAVGRHSANQEVACKAFAHGAEHSRQDHTRHRNIQMQTEDNIDYEYWRNVVMQNPEKFNGKSIEEILGLVAELEDVDEYDVNDPYGLRDYYDEVDEFAPVAEESTRHGNIQTMLQNIQTQTVDKRDLEYWKSVVKKNPGAFIGKSYEEILAAFAEHENDDEVDCYDLLYYDEVDQYYGYHYDDDYDNDCRYRRRSALVPAYEYDSEELDTFLPDATKDIDIEVDKEESRIPIVKNYDVGGNIEDWLKVGMEIEGTVTSIRDYAAFIDIGIKGQKGFLHVTEMPDEELIEGQIIKCRIKAVSPKIYLSCKKYEKERTTLDGLIEEEYYNGGPDEPQYHHSVVVHVDRTGAYVDIGAQNAALLSPKALLKGGSQDLSKELSVGDTISKVVITEVNPYTQQLRVAASKFTRIFKKGKRRRALKPKALYPWKKPRNSRRKKLAPVARKKSRYSVR